MSRLERPNQVQRLAAMLEPLLNVDRLDERWAPYSHASSASPTQPLVSVDSSAVTALWPTTTLEAIHAEGSRPINWVVRGLIEQDSGPVLLVGQPGAFKSWISLHIADCIVTGQPVFGRFQVPTVRPALFLNFDTGSEALRRRSLLFQPSPLFYVATPEAFNLRILENVMKQHHGAFVCIDCFANAYQPEPGAEQAADMRRFAQQFRRLFEEHACSGMVIDHARRQRLGEGGSSEPYYGSVQKMAVFRQMWMVEQVKQKNREPGTARARVRCLKMSESEAFEPINLNLTWTTSAFSATYVVPDDDDAVDRVSLAYDAVRDALLGQEKGLSSRALADQTGFKKAEILAAVKRSGIDTVGHGKNTRYRLASTAEVESDKATE